MKLAALLAKATAHDPAALTAREVLRMATRGGAQAARWPEAAQSAGQTPALAPGGSIEPGCPADLALIDLNSPRLTPLNAAEAALVYAAAAADVTGVIVAGQVVMRDRKLCGVDEAGLLAECRAAAEQLARRLA